MQKVPEKKKSRHHVLNDNETREKDIYYERMKLLYEKNDKINEGRMYEVVTENINNITKVNYSINNY